MGLVSQALRSILPRGSALWLKDQGQKVIEGVAEPIEALKTTTRGVIDEAWPGTATDTLQAWHRTLGVIYDQGRTVADQRIMLEAMETARGGTAIGLLEAQIQKEFPTIILTETLVDSQAGEDECGVAVCGDTAGLIDYTSYTLTGEVQDDTGGPRLSAILARYAPAHMDPVSDLTVLSLNETSEAGEDQCGVAVSEGYDSGDLVAPSFLVNPYLSGTAEIGTNLFAYPGEVDGIESPVITYQWRKNGIEMPGETLPYLMIPGLGTYTCAVTATNSSGFVTFVPTGIASPNTIPILTWDGSMSQVDSPPPPFFTPIIRTRTPTGVSADGNPSPTISFQWFRNSVLISTNISYTFLIGDGANYELVITATNIAGSDSKSSGVFTPW